MIPTQPTGNAKRIAIAAISLFAAGLATLILGMVIGGTASGGGLADPGDFVRWGHPLAKVALNTSMAIAVGTLVFASFVLSAGSKALAISLNLAAGAAAVWTMAAALNFLLTYLEVTASPLTADDSFGAGLWQFATQISLGQSLALNALAAAVISLLVLGVRGLTGTALLAAFGLAALIPFALIGHAAGTAGHAMAVNALGLHLVGVVIWVGGLVALFAIRGCESGDAVVFVRRYSSLALAAFGLVAVSGIASAAVRLSSWQNLFTEYGLLVALKASALILLGTLGALYRLRLINSLSTQKGKIFWRVIVVELILMGSALGLATALARTPTPGSQVTTPVTQTPAQILTGEPLPPELTALSYLTAFKIDLLWLLVALAASVAYLVGVRRLHKRGDKWPIGRTASWLGGMALLAYITNGALNVYQEYLFSVHMIAHMALTMAVPVLLVPGAPVTLLMRAVEKRSDESRGLREWVLWAVHTKYAQFVSHPLVAAVLFASSLVVFYFTPIFAWSTSEHIGHEWMVLHFLITGYLFVQALIGIDPGPKRYDYPIRIMLLIGTLAFHAFFGLALMNGSGLLLADWYGAMGRTWGDTPLGDQQTGGAIAWGIGEIPTAVLTIITSVQWSRADSRESRRLDRASDRSGNEDLEQYNAMLARLAKRDGDK